MHVLRVHVLPVSLENFSQPGAMDPKMLVHAHVVILSCQQMPCNTPACHDDMSHIRIGSSPPYPLLLSNKHVVPENAVQTCQVAAWGARRWEEHDARRRLFFQSVFEPGGQEGLLALRLVSCKLSIAYICIIDGQFGIPSGQRRRFNAARRPPSLIWRHRRPLSVTHTWQTHFSTHE